MERRRARHSDAIDPAAWLLTSGGVIGVATALLFLAFLENTVLPWAPFFFFHAALTTLVPLALRTYSFGRLRSLRPLTWVAMLAAPFVIQLLGVVWQQIAYPVLLGLARVDPTTAAGPLYSFNAAFQEVFHSAGLQWGVGARTLQLVYLTFVMLWAGFGEELFFRGYMHGTLRRHHGFAVATLISAGFFAVRHATQLAIISPQYPWGAAFSWVLFAFIIGIFMSYLYEKTGSLYPPVIAHYILNFFPLLAPLLDRTP